MSQTPPNQLRVHAKPMLQVGIGSGGYTSSPMSLSTGFPTNPVLGDKFTLGTNEYVYINNNGIDVWYPLVINDNQTFSITQATAQTEWDITHNLNTQNFFYYVQDLSNNSLTWSGDTTTGTVLTTLDSNHLKLVFTQPHSGFFFMVALDNLNVNNINATQLNIGNVKIDTDGLYLNGELISSVSADQVLAELTNATETQAGLMSASDKTKLDNSMTSDQVNAAIAAAIATLAASLYSR